MQAKFTIEELAEVSNPFDEISWSAGSLVAKPWLRAPGPVIYGLYVVQASFDIEDIFAKNSVGYLGPSFTRRYVKYLL